MTAAQIIATPDEAARKAKENTLLISLVIANTL